MSAIPSNPAGWFMSEKLDGCRCIVTESGRMLSRNGRPFNPPRWFTDYLPLGVRLDCELYAGRGGFDHLVSEIQRKNSDWQGIELHIFDMAVLRVPVEFRIGGLEKIRPEGPVRVVKHIRCKGNDHLDRMEHDIVSNGGEGVCLREPCSFYKPHGFVKVKRLFPDLNRSHLD